MNWFLDLNLIHCLDVYLLLTVGVGVAFRILQYRALLGFVWSMNGRWPQLFRLVRQHRGVFLTWGTILPLLLVLALSVGHMLACRLLWPQVDVTIGQLLHWWLASVVAALLGMAMLCSDCHGAWQIEKWDRGRVEKELDLAEHWLQSWKAPVVRVFTLGFIHPRKMVGIEVRKALVEASEQLNNVLWWSSLPISLRIAFVGTLWLTYICGHP